jgi:hypothetical protein
MLNKLLFESPFDFDYFKRLKTIVSEDRDLDYIYLELIKYYN